MITLLTYVAGGQLFFTAKYLPAFLQIPLSFLSLKATLFDLWGALFSAILCGYVYVQRRRSCIWRTLDALTVVFASVALGLGLSHIASGAAFGNDADLPWAIDLRGTGQHAAQWCETIAAVFVFSLVWIRSAR